MNKPTAVLFVLLVSLLLLVGCGGGNSSSNQIPTAPVAPVTPTPTIPATAEGVWVGTATSGSSTYTFEGIFLPSTLNNKMYAIYYGSGESGLVTADSSSSNGQWWASCTGCPPGENVVGYEFLGPAYPTMSLGSLSGGNYSATSLTGVLKKQDGTAVAFSGSVPLKSQFIYNTPANMSDIVGTWTGVTFDGVAEPIQIASNGTFTWQLQPNPAMPVGTKAAAVPALVVPDVSKNFFWVFIDPKNPLTGGGTSLYMGVAVVVTTDSGAKQLLAVVDNTNFGTSNAAPSGYGTVLIGSR